MRLTTLASILSEPAAAVAPVQPDPIKELTKEYAELRKEIDSLKADMKRNSRCISVSYGDSNTYKALALQMLQQVSEEQEGVFLCQIYTILKTHKRNMEKKQKC